MCLTVSPKSRKLCTLIPGVVFCPFSCILDVLFRCFFSLPAQKHVVAHSLFAVSFDVSHPHLGVGTIATLIPAECLRPFWVARGEALQREGGPASPLRVGMPQAALWLLLRRKRLSELQQRCPLRRGRLQVPAQSVTAKGGARLPMMTTITAASAFARHGFRPAPSHCHHRMTGFQRPRLLACHQVFSHHPSLTPTAHLLASAQSTARCGSASTTLSLPIAKMTGTGVTHGVPDSPARQAGTPLSFLTFAQMENRLSNSWNSRPVGLLVVLFVQISAAGVRLTSFRSSPGILDLHGVLIRLRILMARGM